MKEKWNFLLYLIWFSYLVISAIRMFGHGFLLSRKTLNDVSSCLPLSAFDCEGRENELPSIPSCTEEEKIWRLLSKPGAPMICLPARNRVVFLLVDALRYDFTEYDDKIDQPLPYQNKLLVINDLLKKNPESTRLFRFMADPPTTTLQRIKALVTGSLPTFVDASSNFAAMELQEDNIIDQLSQNGGKAVILGDDTWVRLLPNRWLRSHALYSFHTWDLDTVDKEIDSKIYGELQNQDWDLLVCHYLGIDHAGHRYGPNHSEMTRKLKELNTRLQRIIEILPPDVMLYVIGDHGMTETDSPEWTELDGDHGGESKAERTAAFFAYRGAGLYNNKDSVGSEVQQADFAFTLSAALGRPPPAPSLGNLLLPVLPTETIPESLIKITNGLKQIAHYLMRYGEESQQVSLEKLAHFINATRGIINKAADVKTESDFENYVLNARTLVENIRSTFRVVWVEFDSLSMLRALLLLLLAVFFNWIITDGIPIERIPNIFASTFVPTGIVSMAIAVGICTTGYYFELLEDLEHAIILSTGLSSGVVVCALVVMHWDGISQRWYEARLQFYERFARIALFASALALLSNSYIIEEGASLSFLFLGLFGAVAWNIRTVKAFALWVSCGVALAVTRVYRGCREEQGACWTAGEAAGGGRTSRAGLVLALACTGAAVAAARRRAGWRGRGAAAGAALVCAHWAAGWGALGSPARARLLARLAWLALAVTFASLWRRDRSGAELPLSVLALLLHAVNALALGAAVAPAAALALVSGYLVLHMVTLMKNEGSSKFSVSIRCNTSVACMWALLASYHFYGTGHHATLGHMSWAPAFHAGDPNYISHVIGPYVSAALVCLNLFGMPLMFGAAVPLLALWGKNGASNVGPRTQLAAIFSLCLKFGLCFAIRMFVCALAATIHCRHLMIWGVFTPKLIFEYGACCAALVGVVLGSALAIWHLPGQQRSS